jgi:hypothetical protein
MEMNGVFDGENSDELMIIVAGSFRKAPSRGK